VFVIERHSTNKKTNKSSCDVAYGVTSQSPQQADAKSVLSTNRSHWCIENSCHYIVDWNYDEDRSRISKGYGPENISRLRRFAVGLIKSKKTENVAQKMRQLMRNTRMVLDYLRMTENSCTAR
jgi:predicted transposase YbfD/YdcC